MKLYKDRGAVSISRLSNRALRQRESRKGSPPKLCICLWVRGWDMAEYAMDCHLCGALSDPLIILKIQMFMEPCACAALFVTGKVRPM